MNNKCIFGYVIKNAILVFYKTCLFNPFLSGNWKKKIRIDEVLCNQFDKMYGKWISFKLLKIIEFIKLSSGFFFHFNRLATWSYICLNPNFEKSVSGYFALFQNFFIFLYSHQFLKQINFINLILTISYTFFIYELKPL